MPNELKPCPFCGCKAVLYENKIVDKTYYGITCMNCTVRIFGFATKEIAMQQWNRRNGNDE